jgi:hypothetical protein
MSVLTHIERAAIAVEGYDPDDPAGVAALADVNRRCWRNWGGGARRRPTSTGDSNTEPVAAAVSGYVKNIQTARRG